MSLSLEYEDKYRLWAALVQGAADRLFVPTGTPPALGTTVPLRVAVPSQDVQTIIRGQVVGRRRQGDRFPGGVYLRFSHEELDTCRGLLGLAQPQERHRGRRWPRVYRTLELRFREPEVRTPCAAKNLSEAGLLATCPAALFAGQRVEVTLTLDDGSELPLSAEVVWVKPSDELAGLRLVELPPGTSERLTSAILRMIQASPRRATHVVVAAEGDTESMELLEQVLTSLRAELFAAQDGEDVLSLARSLQPSLVVLDALMPGVDAVDICKRMHADVELAEIPVVFHAACEPGRLHALADEAGATDYLPKPAPPEEISRVLGAYLGSHEAP